MALAVQAAWGQVLRFPAQMATTAMLVMAAMAVMDTPPQEAMEPLAVLAALEGLALTLRALVTPGMAVTAALVGMLIPSAAPRMLALVVQVELAAMRHMATAATAATAGMVVPHQVIMPPHLVVQVVQVVQVVSLTQG